MGPPGGMTGPGMGGIGPPGGMGPMGPPPRYSSMQSMPQYEPPRGGMPGGDRFAHSGGPMSDASSTAAPSEKPMRGPSRRQPGGNTRVPMGAFAKAAKSPRLSRSRTEPTTADRLNRGQPDGRRVGPSGHEWLKGDSFLDACMCTTGCTCRKGHRVLYRSRDDPAGSESEYEAGPRYTSGEIRYVLGSKLGQDCGDHSGCKKKSASSSSESESDAKRRKKKEEKTQKKQFQGLKEDVLEAIDQKLDAIKKARSSKASSLGSPRPPFAGLGAAPNAFGMGDPAAMDPLMARKLSMGNMGIPMSANPYAMGMQGLGKLPPGMMDPMSGRQMRPGQMPIGAIGFEEDMSMGDMEGMAVGNPYLGGGMKSRGMQARFISPGRRKDMDPMAFYNRAGGRGGMMGNRIPRDPRRRRFGSDDFEVPGGRLGLKDRGNGRSGGIGDGAGDALGRDDDDGMMAATHRGSPSGAQNAGRTSDRERGRNARAETDDDDEY
ncbi:hypothetical protein FB567DRAFT_599378 [Paraphoma chrysanthemicola]|uniref:Uncharacterized protein n=1 Tax=Paraphoma chrysanthemicola TaxID=798071 RepID=A0A8K0QSB7_9PLEO|nr:hypothetical protein FB567DRAFT_599378 [Paraphoma chrysanthemicola]